MKYYHVVKRCRVRAFEKRLSSFTNNGWRLVGYSHSLLWYAALIELDVPTPTDNEGEQERE